MREVTVYSMEACVTCDQVKGMLDAREIPHDETVVNRDSPRLDELSERSGMKTLAQVYVGAILIGGGTETMAAAASGYEHVIVVGDSDEHRELSRRTGIAGLAQVFVGSLLLGGYEEVAVAAEAVMLADLLVD